MADQYQGILEYAHELAEKAGKLVREGSAARWTQQTGANEKKNSVDLVTETDQAVEVMLRAAIAERYPSHKFIGEESFAAGERQELTDEFTWIVDPIDLRTFQVSHTAVTKLTDSPFVACSIGVTHMSKPVVGVILMPFFDHVYSARLGGGAFFNRTTPLPLTGGIPQPLTELRKCMFATEWGSARFKDNLDAKVTSFARLAGDPNTGVEKAIMAHAQRNGHLLAGAIILSETGGFWHGGKEAFERAASEGEVLMSRRYVFVRAVPPTETETAKEIQRRLVKELYDVVVEWDYRSPQ
ncbi:hypothetical protein IAU60_005117 [Kwoniella sp. DSM 27419]